jgi:hypothetical protein
MSEPKSCPLGYRDMVGFSLCLKEKREWWVGEKNIILALDPEPIFIPGHCVVFDWGKKC